MPVDGLESQFGVTNASQKIGDLQTWRKPRREVADPMGVRGRWSCRVWRPLLAPSGGGGPGRVWRPLLAPSGGDGPSRGRWSCRVWRPGWPCPLRAGAECGDASPVPASSKGAALLGPRALFAAPQPPAWPSPRRTFHLERRDHELPSV